MGSRAKFSRHARQSFALVIVLVFVVLLSAVVVAFLSKALLLRRVSNSSANQTKANLFAQGALDTIVGDLKQEIADGSTAYTSNNFVIYIPKITSKTVSFSLRTSYTSVEPAYQGFLPTFTTLNVETDGLNNLLKVSSPKPFYTNTFLPPTTVITGPTRGSASYTTNSSQNGRTVSPLRWNKPLLIAQKNAASATDFTPVTAFPTPTWVLVAHDGSNPTTLDTSTSVTTSNVNPKSPKYVMGRFAYAIYNEGGLLDISVAGVPNTVSTDFISRRGILPQVDISSVPGVLDASSLVQWRNHLTVTATSATTYTNYVLTATNGFTTVAAGDQTFISRQYLLQYVKDHSAQITPQALQYLGTFSRELNAPSYFPPASGSPARPKTLAGEGYRYVSDPGNLDDDYNPSLINFRNTTTGEPLIKNRFPLSRLNWIGHAGPAGGANAAQIYSAFGLTYSAGVWIYSHASVTTPPSVPASVSTIKTLSQVAAAGRDPDFFELLQAGIFVGSLGKIAVSVSPTSNTYLFDSKSAYQIAQIVANLVDQYDADSYPTRISLDGQEFDGIENLPYLDIVYNTAYRLHGTSEPSGFPRIGVWYQPRIWNPHANASTLPASGSGPTQFRYIPSGSVFVQPSWAAASPVTSFPDPTVDPDLHNLTATTGILFSTSAANTYSQPTVLSSTVGATATGVNSISDAGNSFIGINAGIANPAPMVVPPDSSIVIGDVGSPIVTHQLQYWDGSQWITYSRMKNHTGTYNSNDYYADNFQTFAPRGFDLRAGEDPRTDRFGATGNYIIANTVNSPSYSTSTQTFSPNTISPIAGSDGCAWSSPTNSGWRPGSVNTVTYAYSTCFGDLAQNIYSPLSYSPPNPASYADPDGSVRRAVGAYASTSSTANGGYPLTSDATIAGISRPIILNRPFRSVAEMGYASRDLPWKDLDFFTIESPDASLLDLFCLNESPQVAAGRVDLNTRQLPVIQAILAGEIKSDSDNTIVTSADAGTLANNLFAVRSPSTYYANTGLADTPTSNGTMGLLLNRSQLVTRWMGTIAPTTTPAYPVLTASPDTVIKRRREAAIRALADVGNTRTWNLLIDVVAQTGRYATTATNIDQFTVEGERRVWLHIAIDRYTGKVISQYLEPVYE